MEPIPSTMTYDVLNPPPLVAGGDIAVGQMIYLDPTQKAREFRYDPRFTNMFIGFRAPIGTPCHVMVLHDEHSNTGSRLCFEVPDYKATLCETSDGICFFEAARGPDSEILLSSYRWKLSQDERMEFLKTPVLTQLIGIIGQFRPGAPSLPATWLHGAMMCYMTSWGLMDI